mmetsp:Transcript_112639/g.359826  ORF Transcript_112639/g.359826 Transcript_112639/m.359826 type:complete len:227 (+) Transcript_112639:3387-4067(+)
MGDDLVLARVLRRHNPGFVEVPLPSSRDSYCDWAHLHESPQHGLLSIFGQFRPAVHVDPHAPVLHPGEEHVHLPAVLQEVLPHRRLHALLLQLGAGDLVEVLAPGCLQRDAIPHHVVEGELGCGPLAASLPAALLRIGHAGYELVHREILAESVDLGMCPHHRLRGVSPTGTALALVPGTSDGGQVRPTEGLRQAVWDVPGRATREAVHSPAPEVGVPCGRRGLRP